MQDISYFTLALTSFVFAITPGPGVVAVLATSINRGILSGVVMTLGEVTGDMLYLIIAMVSLAGLSQNMEHAMLAVRILGAMYLAWIGVQIYRSPPLVKNFAPTSARSLGMAFGTGFMISITNPKVIVFYLSFLPLFIDLSALTITSAASVMAVMFVSVFAGPTLIAILGNHAAKLATGPRSGRVMNRITGLMMLGVAAALILTI